MTIGRRRIVLVEKFLPKNFKKHEPSEAFKPLITPIFSNNDLFVDNRFIVELEQSNGTKIEESRIRGFKIHNSNGEKVLKIKTFLHIKEWVTDYEKIVIARITLLDNTGNEVQVIDLDICYDGYSLECDYTSSAFMIPVFSYIIL
jgi:hypothetical protein